MRRERGQGLLATRLPASPKAVLQTSCLTQSTFVERRQRSGRHRLRFG